MAARQMSPYKHHRIADAKPYSGFGPSSSAGFEDIEAGDSIMIQNDDNPYGDKMRKCLNCRCTLRSTNKDTLCGPCSRKKSSRSDKIVIPELEKRSNKTQKPVSHINSAVFEQICAEVSRFCNITVIELMDSSRRHGEITYARRLIAYILINDFKMRKNWIFPLLNLSSSTAVTMAVEKISQLTRYDKRTRNIIRNVRANIPKGKPGLTAA